MLTSISRRLCSQKPAAAHMVSMRGLSSVTAAVYFQYAPQDLR